MAISSPNSIFRRLPNKGQNVRQQYQKTLRAVSKYIVMDFSEFCTVFDCILTKKHVYPLNITAKLTKEKTTPTKDRENLG